MNTVVIFDMVDQLIACLPLTVQGVSTILHTQIVRERASDTAGMQVYALPAGLTGGRFRSVDLRMPDPDIGDGTVFLSVTPRNGESLDQDAICMRFGTDFRTEVPSPSAPHGEVPLYLSFPRPWGLLSFGVTNDEQRALVRFILSTAAG